MLFGSENSCSPNKRPHTEEATDSTSDNNFETANPKDIPVTENRPLMNVSSAGGVAKENSTDSVEGIVLVNVLIYI